MCLHGCIVFLQQDSTCDGHNKADHDQCIDQSGSGVLRAGGVHADLADAPLTDGCKDAAEDAAQIGVAGVLVQETADQNCNKDEAGQCIDCSCGRSQTAEHGVRAGSFEDTVNIAEDEQGGNRSDKADQKIREQLVLAECGAEVEAVDADGHDDVVHEIHRCNKDHARDAVGTKLHKAPVDDQEVHIHEVIHCENDQDQCKDCKQGRADGLEECTPGDGDAGILEGETVFFAVGHVPHRAQNKSQRAAQQGDQAVVRRVGRVEKCITVRCQSLLVQESNNEDGQDGTDDLDAPEPCNGGLVTDRAESLLAIVCTLERLDGADQPDHQRTGKQQQTGQSDDLKDVPDGIGVAAGTQGGAGGHNAVEEGQHTVHDKRRPPACHMRFVGNKDLTASGLSAIILLVNGLCHALFAGGCRVDAEIQEGLCAVIDHVFRRAGKVGCVLVGIVGVGAVIVCLFREEELIVFVCENCDIAGTVNIGVAFAVAHDGVAVDQEDGLDDVQAVVIALQCFAGCLAAAGVAQQRDPVGVNVGQGHAVAHGIIKAAALGEPFGVGQRFAFAHAVHIHADRDITAAGKLDAVMLHLFFVVIAAVLHKNGGCGRFGSGILRDIDIHCKCVAGFGFNGNVPNGRFAGVRLQDEGTGNAYDDQSDADDETDRLS